MGDGAGGGEGAGDGEEDDLLVGPFCEEGIVSLGRAKRWRKVKGWRRWGEGWRGRSELGRRVVAGRVEVKLN